MSAPDAAAVEQATADLAEFLSENITLLFKARSSQVTAEACVRALGLVIAACAKPGERATLLRLGAAMLQQLADVETNGGVN